jgi:hypothetical protein
MEKYNLGEGNDSLKKILLMMKYNNKKTLSENVMFINEQSSFEDAANVAQDLVNSLVGDVKTSDLNDIEKILNDRVFGKRMSDGKCLLSKVNEYFKNTKTSRWFTWGVLVPGDYKSRYLKDMIRASEESGEPQFEDVKQQLIKLIESEENGFCKTNDTVKNNKNESDGLTELTNTFPCIVNQPGFKYEKKDDKGWYFFKILNKKIAIKSDGTTSVNTNGKWENLKTKTSCSNNVAESVIYEDINNPELMSLLNSNQTNNNNNNNKNNQTSIESLNDIITTKSIIKKNTKSPAVKEIKTKLSEKLKDRFAELGIQMDETYDQKTVGLVAYYQALNNLKVDGIVGPETAASLSN